MGASSVAFTQVATNRYRKIYRLIMQGKGDLLEHSVRPNKSNASSPRELIVQDIKFFSFGATVCCHLLGMKPDRKQRGTPGNVTVTSEDRRTGKITISILMDGYQIPVIKRKRDDEALTMFVRGNNGRRSHTALCVVETGGPERHDEIFDLTDELLCKTFTERTGTTMHLGCVVQGREVIIDHAMTLPYLLN